MAKGITIKGGAANSFIAEMLVDEHGEGARDKCSGPMLADVNAVLERRASGQAPLALKTPELNNSEEINGGTVLFGLTRDGMSKPKA